MTKSRVAATAALISMFANSSVLAAPGSDLQALRAEILAIKQTYGNRISELESTLTVRTNIIRILV